MNDQTERQNQILKHYLHCYWIKKQDNWVNLLSLAEFTYINVKQATLKCSSFFVLMRYNISIHYNVENNILKGKISAVKKRIKKLHKIRKMMLKYWKKVIVSQVRAYNKRHQSKSYWVENLMLLLTKNLSQKHSHKKLLHKFAESFCICDIIDQQVYCLSLFISYWIYNVFYVSYLKLYSQYLNNETVSELSLSDLIDETEKYEIEEILRWQKKKKCDIRFNERTTHQNMINESRNKIWQRCKIYNSAMIWMYLYKKEIIKTKIKEH